MPPPTPHDALFKATFSQPEHAAGELRHVLPPALAARLDFPTLELQPGSFVDEGLRQQHSDLLFAISAGEARVLVYVLFEHQSSADPLMPFRLLRYMVRIWEAHLAAHPECGRLPAIVPVVLHHSESGWTKAVAFEELLDLDAGTLDVLRDYLPRFRFVLDDISKLGDEDLRARDMTAFARLVLWCLRHARAPREWIARVGQWLDLVREVRRLPRGTDALRLLWRYALVANEESEQEDFLRALLLEVGTEEKEEIVSVADQLIEKGRREGRQEGRQEGLRDARRAMLLKLLGSRFGALAPEVVARVEAADLARLDTWFERALGASSLDEALRDG